MAGLAERPSVLPMTSLTRAAIFILGLLLLLVMAGIAGEQWLSRQRETLRAEWVASRRADFEALLPAADLGTSVWSEDARALVRSALGSTEVRTHPAGAPIPEGRWGFSVSTGTAGGEPYQVSLPSPRLARVLGAYQKAILALGLLCLLLGGSCVGLLIFFATQRSERSEGSPGQLANRPDLISLAGLARMSAEQQAQLQLERIERLRIQEDLNFQQMLLNRALEEKIRLGHDLHDGIIQALYATGLTLEAALKASETDAALARRHVTAARELLNQTIRDVRSYILGLTPDVQHQQTLPAAIESVTQAIASGTEVAFELAIEDQVAGRLTSEQHADIVQIVREAVSNSIRHGGATRIRITLSETPEGPRLAIVDNGRGFDPLHAVRGHGLSNIQTRGQRLNAKAQVASSPGNGTQIQLTLPT